MTRERAVGRRRRSAPRRGRSVLCALSAGAAICSLAISSATAEARPQITSGVTTGGALTDLRSEGAPHLAYHLGARLDLLLLRSGPREMAIGPYVDVASAAFDTFESGGGVAWLVPAGETAFVFSGGAFARTSRLGWEPGASATIFWGSRSYNFHSAYAIGAGLFAQGRYGLGDSRQGDGIVGVQIDLEYLALPFVYAYQAIAH